MKDKLINIVLLMQIIVTAIVIIPSDEQYNIIKIYTNIKAKYDTRHLREEKFLKILYNTRVAEYKDRIIKEVDIENLIEVVIERYQKIQRNKLKKMNLSSWKEELVIAIFTSELENNLYEYLKVPKAKIRKRKIEVDN